MPESYAPSFKIMDKTNTAAIQLDLKHPCTCTVSLTTRLSPHPHMWIYCFLLAIVVLNSWALVLYACDGFNFPISSLSDLVG